MAALEHHQNNALAPPTISDQGAALADWLAARGGACHPRVDLRRRRDDDVGGERSAVAAAPIAAGELLLRVPARCALRRDDEDALVSADGILEDAEAPYAATLPKTRRSWTRGRAESGPSSRARASRAPAATTEAAPDVRAIRALARAAQLDDGSWALVPGVDALNDGRGRAAPCTTLEVDGDGVFEMVASRDLGSGEELTHCSGQEFPTSKAPISADFHSFRLIFGRAIISRNGLDAWMLFPERARGTLTLKRLTFLPRHCYDEFARRGELLERYGFAPPGAAPAPRVFRVAELLDACGAAAPERLRPRRGAPDGLCAVVRGAPLDALLSAVAALVASDDDFAAWEAAVDDGLAGGAPERDLWILDAEAAAGDAAPRAIAAALRRLASSALARAADGAFDGFAGPAHRAASARRVRDDEVAACGRFCRRGARPGAPDCP
ncbi:hypothetical protein JL720_16570 [Aureococcus anophagefferens]|nr:hypothetical protein JL720_16570 [Aureococcus anophagefferens]